MTLFHHDSQNQKPKVTKKVCKGSGSHTHQFAVEILDRIADTVLSKSIIPTPSHAMKQEGNDGAKALK